MLRTLLVLLLSLALPLSASADSLVAAARKERARRAKLRSNKTVLTNNKLGVAASAGTVNQAPKTKANTMTASGPDSEKKDAKAEELAEWKKRFTEARQAIDDAERDLELARTKSTIVLTDQMYADGNEFNRRAQQDAALEERSAAEKALSDARDALKELQEEARRAGVPAYVRR